MSENEKKFRCPTQAPVEAYSFEWSIEDFRYVCSAKSEIRESLFSENITTGESSLKTEWCIELKMEEEGTIGVYLNRVSSNESLPLYVIYNFHIVSSDKKKVFKENLSDDSSNSLTEQEEGNLSDDSSNSLTEQEEGNLSDDSSNSLTEQEEGNLSDDSSNSLTEQGEGNWYNSPQGWGKPNFIVQKKLFDKEQLLLPNGTLTIVCEFQVSVIDDKAVPKLTQELSEVTNYTAIVSENVKKFRCRTQLLKEASNFEWSIKNFSAMCSAKTQVNGILRSETFTTDESSLDSKFYIQLEFTNNDTIGKVCLFRFSKKTLLHYWIFSFSIVGSNKKNYFTEQLEGCFYGDSFRYWEIENFINRKKLFEEEQLLLPNDTLTIVCEFQVSVLDASIVSELTQESNTIHSSTSDFEKPDLPMDDLPHLYTSQMFSDFTLKVGEEELKVHKKVLCKSSSVFSTLLNCDMKGNCLEITDFDPSIVKTMLRYIYCGQVQDLSPELCVQLYSIAEIYNLQDLKGICVEYILGNLDSLMDDLYISRMFSDFTLKVGDEEIKVHKLILCARSSVFNTTLNCDMKENRINCLEITDFDPSIVKTMLRYIYCSQVQDLSPELSVQLYSIADKYNLQDLKDICVQHILGNIKNSRMKNNNTQRGININTTISINSLYCVLVLVISILYFLILY